MHLSYILKQALLNIVKENIMNQSVTFIVSLLSKAHTSTAVCFFLASYMFLHRVSIFLLQLCFVLKVLMDLEWFLKCFAFDNTAVAWSFSP